MTRHHNHLFLILAIAAASSTGCSKHQETSSLGGSQRDSVVAHLDRSSPLSDGFFVGIDYMPDTGDLVGLNVHFIHAMTQDSWPYYAVIQDAEGAPGEPILSKVNVKGDSVAFDTPWGEFRGTISDTSLVGTVAGERHTLSRRFFARAH
jgi:hypothetical protein